jgi:hypothetical protein
MGTIIKPKSTLNNVKPKLELNNVKPKLELNNNQKENNVLDEKNTFNWVKVIFAVILIGLGILIIAF